ncbi:hypothetical protein NDU88_002712 [Pleurodeles waltl]|uniref:Uncharacterized protein n=1 Tax=Pleurodeles waltl TaxID=8319 RepID=A0AAV7MS85_PLEWA|nr:hypothetical protein NDU88_002712 [Pleurodeles waltl]
MGHTLGLRTPLRLLPASAGRQELADDGEERGRAPPPQAAPGRAAPTGVRAGCCYYCCRCHLRLLRKARLRTPYSVLQMPAAPDAPGALTDVLTWIGDSGSSSGSGSEGGS